MKSTNIPRNTRSGVKCAINEEKEKQARKSNIPGAFSDKVIHATNFTDDPVVQCECDVSVVKNTFMDDHK